MLILAVLIFLATLLFILWGPRGIKEVWFALMGAAAMLALGYVSFDEVIALAVETGPVLLFLIGMLVVGFVADQAGLFKHLALYAVTLSRGDGRRLFVGLYLLGVVITMWFSLDTTAVILAPIVYNVVRSLNLPPLPFVLATTYVANTASLFLPISNLTNLIVWERFDIPFWDFALVLFLPSVAAVAANLALFLWLFRKQIPKAFAYETKDSEVADRPSPFVSWSLVALLIGLGLAPFFNIEVWIIALIGAGVLALHAVSRTKLPVRTLAAGVGWDLLPFVFSLFIILRGVGNAGFTEFTQSLLLRVATGEGFAQLLAVAGLTALGSNLINNLPMILVAADSLASPLLTGDITLKSLYAALIGTNVGPNLTVIGSLATMIALSIIGTRGLRVSGLQYIKIGIVSVPVLLVCTVLGLWLVFAI